MSERGQANPVFQIIFQSCETLQQRPRMFGLIDNALGNVEFATKCRIGGVNKTNVAIMSKEDEFLKDLLKVTDSK